MTPSAAAMSDRLLTRPCPGQARRLPACWLALCALISLGVLTQDLSEASARTSRKERRAQQEAEQRAEQERVEAALREEAPADSPQQEAPVLLAELAPAPGNAPSAPAANPSMADLLEQGSGPSIRTETAAVSAPSSGGAGGASLWVLGFGMMLMGGGIGAGVAVKARGAKHNKLLGTSNSLRHVKSMRLSPKHQISLIEAQDRLLVIGVTSAQISLLADLGTALDAEQLVDGLLDAPQPNAEHGSPKVAWASLFDDALKARQKGSAPAVTRAAVNPAPIAPTPEPVAPMALGAEPVAPVASPEVMSLKARLKLSEERAPEPFSAPPVAELAPVESVATTPEEADFFFMAGDDDMPAPTTQSGLHHLEEQSALVAETSDYTLEEPFDAPRHDGMFAAHDAVHHAAHTFEQTDQEEEPSEGVSGEFFPTSPSRAKATQTPLRAPSKMRRSRESDSMLIALAAMRQEVGQ